MRTLEDPSVFNLPPIDLQEVYEEDLINDRDKTIPWRYGIVRDIEVNVTEVGSETILDNGDKVYRLAITSPNAENISVNFDDFFIPEGGKLFLYNEDNSELLLPLSSDQNRTNRTLGSWFLNGETIYVEYVQTEDTDETVSLRIGSIIHGYRMGAAERYVDQNRGLNDSGACNMDVNCFIGNDFEQKKAMLKKTVALLNLGNGYLCSAALINNTNNDKTPYLLTANHCLQNSDPAYWSVRFNWMSPNPICGEDAPSADIETNFTMSGAELRASNEQSDFALVEMQNSIPETWDVAFAGWNITDELPSYEVGIHHPQGDIMKICRDDSGAIHENANGVDVWLIGGGSVGEGNGWEIGTTESGSSGSPLFNQNGHLIGQLYAGEAFCDGLENNGGYDIYGRLAVSWDTGETPETRLKEWLDPQNTGQVILSSIENALNTPTFDPSEALQVYPNPASGFLNIVNNRYPNLHFNLFDVSGRNVKHGSMSDTLSTISLADLPNGIYFLKLTDRDTENFITKKIIIQN
ncbi:T9SS type A sorting domain-containing protein [Flavobacteriaceae bacterium TK19130]|nr:T9SS type A sorting domain-containing protein [Thermobacterium salinum]